MSAVIPDGGYHVVPAVIIPFRKPVHGETNDTASGTALPPQHSPGLTRSPSARHRNATSVSTTRRYDPRAGRRPCEAEAMTLEGNDLNRVADPRLKVAGRQQRWTTQSREHPQW
ncbi:hypothetical protein JCM33774_19770 [Actinophytocola sp. KF-1]